MASQNANRFDLIRLILAGAVAVYHAVVLTAFAPGSALEGTLALAAFIEKPALRPSSLYRTVTQTKERQGTGHHA
jgi:hypothetical protein